MMNMTSSIDLKDLTEQSTIRKNVINLQDLIYQSNILQNDILAKLTFKQQSLQQKQKKIKQKTFSLFQNINIVKQLFNQFGQQLKTQWVSIYQQLLQIITNITLLYQIKIKKLEQQITHKDNKIVQLQQQIFKYGDQSSIKQVKLIQIYQQSQQQSFDQIQNSNNQNSRMVPIKDLIVNYNIGLQQPSIRLFQTKEDQFKITQEQLDLSTSNISIMPEKPILKDSTNKNRTISSWQDPLQNSDCQINPFKSNHASSSNSSIQNSSRKPSKDKLNIPSSKRNKRNSLTSIFNDKNSSFIKKQQTQTSQLQKTYKLDELRKNLFGRKRCDNIL